jgi:hypothetical protein
MGSFLLPCATTGLSLIAVWCLIGATPRGQPWTPAVTLPHRRDGLSVRWMAVLWTFREPSLCRQVHREFMRNMLLDLTPSIPATACHQRNYVETYSRYNTRSVQQGLGGRRCAVPCRHGQKGGRRHDGGRGVQGRPLLQGYDNGGHVVLRDAEPLGEGRQRASGGIAKGAQRRQQDREEDMHPLVGFALPHAEQTSLDHLE